jgi:hypothetical protein
MQPERRQPRARRYRARLARAAPPYSTLSSAMAAIRRTSPATAFSDARNFIVAEYKEWSYRLSEAGLSYPAHALATEAQRLGAYPTHS